MNRGVGESVPKPYPLENVMSPAVRSLSASDFGHRYTARERFLHGHKVHRRNRRVWREISERSFEAETVDLRPFPDIADLFLASFMKPGDTLMCISLEMADIPVYGSTACLDF